MTDNKPTAELIAWLDEELRMTPKGYRSPYHQAIKDRLAELEAALELAKARLERSQDFIKDILGKHPWNEYHTTQFAYITDDLIKIQQALQPNGEAKDESDESN